VPLNVSSHPLVADSLRGLRDLSTQPDEFRVLARKLITLLLYEATADLPVRHGKVQTPLTEAAATWIARDVVAIPPVSEKMLADNVGYIQVDAFPEGKSQEIASKIRDLQKQGAKKLVLDLRNSASGAESEGVAAANLFLDHGTITYLQGQKYPRQAFNADPGKDITKLPVAVLVNRGTAGPAEIVAAAILENARGDVVGDKTFGDGSVQKLIEMQDNSALILSIAKYYSPSGKAIQDAAVTPNVLIADTADDDGGLPDEDQTAAPSEKKVVKPKNQEDEQLNKALEVLKNRESKG